MAIRFGEASLSDIEKLKQNATPLNTAKQTNKWMSAYMSWAKMRNKETDIHKVPPFELDLILQSFYAELKKQDGQDYEPNSLASMQASIDRYLKNNGYIYSIIRDREFASSQSVLEGKARLLRENGKGKRPNRSHSLTKDEEIVLWDCGQLGISSPRSLINTIWWLLTQHLGLRGRKQHHELKLEDFTFKISDRGHEYVTLAEGITKTLQSGLHEKHRLEKPFMFENKSSVCPVDVFKLYISKRPLDMRASGPLYLAIIDKPTTEIWYKKCSIGVNTINTLMQKMVASSPLANTVAKKITNHSARKTLVKKLKSNNVPKSDIIAITGHTTEAGLDDYDSGNEEHQEALSHKIDITPPLHERNASTVTSSNPMSSIPKDDPRLLNPSFLFFPNFCNPFSMSSYGNDPRIPHPIPHPSFSYLQQQQPVQNHYHFNNCSDLKISGFPSQQSKGVVSSSPPTKRRRYVIYDSDSSQEH